MQPLLRHSLFLAPVLLLATLTSLTSAQAPAPQPATSGASPDAAASFEVISVKIVPLDEVERGTRQFSIGAYPTARFFMHSASLNMLIAQAYGIDGHYIDNQPDWGGAQYYDVDATVTDDKPLTREQMQPLLKNLLAQRFRLKVHRENRTVSGYELISAKRGPKLQPAKEGARPKDMPSAFHAQLLPNEMDAWGISTETFAHILVSPAGKPVIDHTGLTGSYDIKLSYAPPNDPNAASTLPDNSASSSSPPRSPSTTSSSTTPIASPRRTSLKFRPKRELCIPGTPAARKILCEWQYQKSSRHPKNPPSRLRQILNPTVQFNAPLN
jgi:uncharacterized protein (TIGR03435 family)